MSFVVGHPVFDEFAVITKKLSTHTSWISFGIFLFIREDDKEEDEDESKDVLDYIFRGADCRYFWFELY